MPKTTKKVVSMEIISPGSPPDIDSDFSVVSRDKAYEYVSDLYGHDNVAHIVTFNTLGAKSAFKRMCTIYKIPFAQANRIAAMMPDGTEGHKITFDDIYNEKSDYYKDGADFRAATSGPNWLPIITGARSIADKNQGTGIHACGVIISDKPLTDTVPLMTDKDDGRVATQWTYQECESLGLIKMDFLGLDTVDLIQHTVRFIQRSGKPAPNMTEIIRGNMDDPDTYRLFQRGETIGVFQFGSELVRDLLKHMKPTEFNDLVACTAVARPGPMGMNSHTMYADRKNGLAEIKSIHPDFKNSPMDEILGQTYGLCIFQEQTMRIASEIAGMTLQEGDKLRKAMGKKKHDIMMKMKPKFINGGIKNGYSEGAMNTLWEVLEPFSRYAFNKSHSVAYAMNAYQAAYLKTHYPVEFMSALVAQTISDRDKTLNNLREARRMGLRVGTVDINLSEVRMSPDYSGESGYEILYGVSGVKSVSEDTARAIVGERERGGRFKSVYDAVTRCVAAGVNNKTVFENLALAGAFDSLDSNRRSVAESIPSLLSAGRNEMSMGMDLFSMGGLSCEDTFSMPDVVDFSYVDRLGMEASMVGLYLSGHPMGRADVSRFGFSTLGSLGGGSGFRTVRVVAAVSGIDMKSTRRGKMCTLHLDDGTGFLSARLSPDVMAGVEKFEAIEDVKARFCRGESVVPEATVEKALKSVPVVETIRQNMVYVMDVSYRPPYRSGGQGSARIDSIRPVTFAHDGSLPIRVRINVDRLGVERARKAYAAIPRMLAEQAPGDTPVLISHYRASDLSGPSVDDVCRFALDVMRQDSDPSGSDATVSSSGGASSLFGESDGSEEKTSTKDRGGQVREWPSQVPPKFVSDQGASLSMVDLADRLDYKVTSCTAEAGSEASRVLEKYLGHQNYDFGVYVPLPEYSR